MHRAVAGHPSERRELVHQAVHHVLDDVYDDLVAGVTSHPVERRGGQLIGGDALCRADHVDHRSFDLVGGRERQPCQRYRIRRRVEALVALERRLHHGRERTPTLPPDQRSGQ